ncbi:MAG: hypothetical protein Kow0042_08490 [Calditrichia bacterium]
MRQIHKTLSNNKYTISIEESTLVLLRMSGFKSFTQQQNERSAKNEISHVPYQYTGIDYSAVRSGFR